MVLRGEVQDQKFIRFLETVGQETLASFNTQDFLVLDLIHREKPVPDHLRIRLAALVRTGVIESIGRGRGTRYLLSRKFYKFTGVPGAYTRKRGLDRDTNKALLLKHIEDNRESGSALSELQEVLPGLSAKQVQHLLTELKAVGKANVVGRTKGARWYPGSTIG